MSRVHVLLLQHGVTAFDYSVPAGMALQPGDVVMVPLGPRRVMGVVWDDDTTAPPVNPAKLKPVIARLDIAPLDAPLRRLIDWVADYYIASPSAVLRMAMPSLSALEPPRRVPHWRFVPGQPPRTARRAEVLERLTDLDEPGALPLAEWARLADTTPAMLRTLAAAGHFDTIAAAEPAPPLPRPHHAPPTLSPAQTAAAARLRAAVTARTFAPLLLHGVTGSGKTEVYFEAIAATLFPDGKGPPGDSRRAEDNEASAQSSSPACGGGVSEADGGGKGQTLVLLPEIALTQPWITRFTARFGVPPTVWHSSLKPAARRAAWRAATTGAAKVIVGARSALFLPLPNLRLIIVDEAHDSAFKQEEGVQYHARDTAVMRAQFAGIPIILSTATPALETREQVARGRYQEITLPARFGGAQLPAITMIDLRRTPPPRGRWIAPPLFAALTETLNRGEQALLFLNRRGYAPLTLCRACGERINCPNCTAWMVEHRLTRRLLCHHCGHQSPVPPACPSCGVEHSLVPCGPGVERLAEEVAASFPAARTALVTSDSVRGADDAAALVTAVQNRELDLLIGTQMITKGYDFPGLTLVGVIDADLGLSGGDLRAAERSFQQIAQVSGRAGRGETAGRVFVQTHMPEAPVMTAIAASDAEGFYAAERDARLRHHMPPFGRLAALVISSEDEAAATDAARAIGATAPAATGFEVWGPAPAPLAMLRGRHRHRLLIHARRSAPLQDYIRRWLAPLRLPASVRVTIDVDPHSFL
ncbi:replication restart helicase PriA [Sandaracinobacteroides saxicola]|uniref:Replication restart protein PriA n=1 Tax=Sandaracinobacteroides saxicola TaxID=2759707 RepID=A0A7G5IES9_9SPHN|nr:primosomal protein N' [Sandaracinobacteroides saxicola]QMW21871.1 primosomal protein N' [Sandaracinobacteroides saxicola]